jgi:hypothetical protein
MLQGQVDQVLMVKAPSEPVLTSTPCKMDDVWVGNTFFIVFLSLSQSPSHTLTAMVTSHS